MRYTTYVKTAVRTYDLGEGERVAACSKDRHSEVTTCPKCAIINAWTGPAKEERLRSWSEYLRTEGYKEYADGD